jgi:hypothetical protein
MIGLNVVAALIGTAKENAQNSDGPAQARNKSGFLHQEILEPIPHYNQAPSESIIKGKSNTIIIMGRDRPGDEGTGKGSTAATHVGCIDIIAGMSGMQAREVNTEGKKVLTNKNVWLDSARIYISQRADIDSPEYFNLAEGKVGNLSNRSAIAIKADSVRLIGREGIKLVTSGDQYSGGAGLFIGDNIQGIDLIAGNNDSDLQPMVKGDDLAMLLDNLIEIVADVQSTASFNLQVIAYTIASFIDPTGTAQKKLQSLLDRMPVEVINLAIQELNLVFHQLNYDPLNPWAYYNFRSKHNNVN